MYLFITNKTCILALVVGNQETNDLHEYVYKSVEIVALRLNGPFPIVTSEYCILWMRIM